MDLKSRNYASCTRRGWKCEKQFHSTAQWESLKRDEEWINCEITKAKEASAWLFAKLARLRKQRKFLKDRGAKMLDHDTLVMD
jgi:hypothetical protein